MYSKPAQANFGVDTWSDEFNEDKKLFDKRYKPSGLQFMPNYPERYTLTGEFKEDGPYASNAPMNQNYTNKYIYKNIFIIQKNIIINITIRNN